MESDASKIWNPVTDWIYIMITVTQWVYIYIYIGAFMHMCVYVCMCLCVSVYVPVCEGMCFVHHKQKLPSDGSKIWNPVTDWIYMMITVTQWVYIYIYIYIYTHVCVYACVYACVCFCIYVWVCECMCFVHHKQKLLYQISSSFTFWFAKNVHGREIM